jgi:hypothetical protein
MTDRLVTPSAAQCAPIHSLRFDSTGRFVHALSNTLALTTWDVGRRAVLRTADCRKWIAPDGDRDIWTFDGVGCFSPRGDRLVLPAREGGAGVFDTLTGRQIISVRPPLAPWKMSWRTEFLADGLRLAMVPLAYGDWDPRPEFLFSLMDAWDGKERQRCVVGPDMLPSDTWSDAAISPDGRYSGSSERAGRAW